jgi:hypothetical protein
MKREHERENVRVRVIVARGSRLRLPLNPRRYYPLLLVGCYYCYLILIEILIYSLVAQETSQKCVL